ncbi:MAG: SDR family oxidoreductase [Clostridiales bacterium]|nr:SDR family oxidoreductase [Clostridiales bacterium]
MVSRLSFAAARAGLEALTYEMAKELGPRGITSNCILIGHIEGDTPEDKRSNEMRAELLPSPPLDAWAFPRTWSPRPASSPASRAPLKPSSASSS